MRPGVRRRLYEGPVGGCSTPENHPCRALEREGEGPTDLCDGATGALYRPADVVCAVCGQLSSRFASARWWLELYAPWLSVKKGALETVRLGKGHRSCGFVCKANAGLASERAEIMSACTSD